MDCRCFNNKPTNHFNQQNDDSYLCGRGFLYVAGKKFLFGQAQGFVEKNDTYHSVKI